MLFDTQAMERHVAQEKPVNIQDTFLNHVRRAQAPVTIFLINGVKLQGVITWFDAFSILLKRDGHSQLTYKHAISTIMPMHPIGIFEDDAQDHTPPPEQNAHTS